MSESRSMSQYETSAQVCECENPERGLFIWRSDPFWWSCRQCDGRVRRLTEREKEEERYGRGPDA